MKGLLLIITILCLVSSCHIESFKYEDEIQGTWKPIKFITQESLKVDTSSSFSFNKGRYNYSSEGFSLDSNYIINNDTITLLGRYPGVQNPKKLMRLINDTLSFLFFEDRRSTSELILIRIRD